MGIVSATGRIASCGAKVGSARFVASDVYACGYGYIAFPMEAFAVPRQRLTFGQPFTMRQCVLLPQYLALLLFEPWKGLNRTQAKNFAKWG